MSKVIFGWFAVISRRRPPTLNSSPLFGTPSGSRLSGEGASFESAKGSVRVVLSLRSSSAVRSVKPTVWSEPSMRSVVTSTPGVQPGGMTGFGSRFTRVSLKVTSTSSTSSASSSSVTVTVKTASLFTSLG